jgi:hypothetical protein
MSVTIGFHVRSAVIATALMMWSSDVHSVQVSIIESVMPAARILFKDRPATGLRYYDEHAVFEQI